MNPVQFIQKTFSFQVRGWQIEPTYWQAAAIVFLLFLLVITLARVRFLFLHWSLGKQNISMIFWGFLLALIVEGFLLIGGRTIFTEILGWKNAPKPISTALDAGRAKLVTVLGMTDEIPTSNANEPSTYQSVLDDYQSLSEHDAQMAKDFICRP